MDALTAQAERLLQSAAVPSVQQLARQLYESLFTHWDRPQFHVTAADQVNGDAGFIAQLAAMTSSAFVWEGGWVVTRRNRDEATVSNGVLALRVSPEKDLQPAQAAVGSAVKLRLPCSRPAVSPGFFHFVSRAGRVAVDAAHLRLYANVEPTGALALMQTLATAADFASLRFEAKCVSHPLLFSRRDPFVFYAEPSDTTALMRALLQFHASHQQLFRADVPGFTEPIAAGLALSEGVGAETPGESFGSARCLLLARGLLRWLEQRAPLSEVDRCVEEEFERDGLTLASPAFRHFRLVRTSAGPEIAHRDAAALRSA